MLRIASCPTCGGKRIRKTRRDVSGQVRGRAYRAVGVLFYECPDCGEKVYDREAMAKIEAARSRVRSRRRAVARVT